MNNEDCIDLVKDALFAREEWLKDSGKFNILVSYKGKLCVNGFEFDEKPEFFKFSDILDDYCDSIDNSSRKTEARLLVRELEMCIKNIKRKIKE